MALHTSPNNVIKLYSIAIFRTTRKRTKIRKNSRRWSLKMHIYSESWLNSSNRALMRSLKRQIDNVDLLVQEVRVWPNRCYVGRSFLRRTAVETECLLSTAMFSARHHIVSKVLSLRLRRRWEISISASDLASLRSLCYSETFCSALDLYVRICIDATPINRSTSWPQFRVA